MDCLISKRSSDEKQVRNRLMKYQEDEGKAMSHSLEKMMVILLSSILVNSAHLILF